MNGDGVAPLVFNAKFASPIGESKRLDRFKYQAAARELLPEHRVAECLRSVVPGVGVVNVNYSNQFKRAHYGNLVQCANVWVCPVCAGKITERRRVELADALGRSPWPGLMVTLTFQHNKHDKLVDLKNDLILARRRLKSGKWWKLFSRKYGIVGTITHTEQTWGDKFGWHIHSHDLYLVESVPDVGALQAELEKHFIKIMASLGRYVKPEIGVNVRVTDKGAASYVSKWGAASEMTKSIVKSGMFDGNGQHYTPFQLLELYIGGAKWAGELFQEYAAAMKGVNQVRWSRGLRRLLSLGEPAADAELVDRPEMDDILLASLTLSEWRWVVKLDLRGELLKVASAGDRERLIAWLCERGIIILTTVIKKPYVPPKRPENRLLLNTDEFDRQGDIWT